MCRMHRPHQLAALVVQPRGQQQEKQQQQELQRLGRRLSPRLLQSKREGERQQAASRQRQAPSGHTPACQSLCLGSQPMHMQQEQQQEKAQQRLRRRMVARPPLLLASLWRLRLLLSKHKVLTWQHCN